MRRLLEEQDKVLRSYFAHKGGTRSKGEERSNCKGQEHVHGCAELVADVKVNVPAVIVSHRQRAASVVGRGWQPW